MNVPANGVKTIEAFRDFQFLWFSEFQRRNVCAGKITNRLGKPADLVFQLAEPLPIAVGIYMEHGWGKPTEFIPWNRVVSIDPDAIFVKPPEIGKVYPPFVDQPGWILVNQHLMGKTILDIDGRRVEVVNDVHLLYSTGRMVIVHVDVSFNGFLRKWGLGSMRWIKDRMITWRYVQPLSVEDAASTDALSLSVKKNQAMDLPGEDLADVLEELSGTEQQAFFSALDSEKAAETLTHAEPRAKRQLIATLRKERAQTILSELSVPQLADLFSVLPHHDMARLMEMLPPKKAERINRIISEQEVTARQLMSSDHMIFPREATVGEVLQTLRSTHPEPHTISYVYVVAENNILMGVVDLRELVLEDEQKRIGDLMVTSVVVAEEDDTREDLRELFIKYHYRMIPVVDAEDHILGVINYNDIIQDLVVRTKT